MAQQAQKILAFDPKTRQRDTPMLRPVINVISGNYIVVGKSAAGNEMQAILNRTKAEEYIRNGVAMQGDGWPKQRKPKK